MNLQNHSKDSGFCSKIARKPLEGFEQACENIWLNFWKDNFGYKMFRGNNFIIQNPITRVLKRTIYCQAKLIIPITKFAPHYELPIIVKDTTIHQSVHITNLRTIFNSSFFLISRHHTFILPKLLDSLFFAFVAVTRGIKHVEPGPPQKPP